MRVRFLLSIATGSALGVLAPVVGGVMGASARAETVHAEPVRAKSTHNKHVRAKPARAKKAHHKHFRARAVHARTAHARTVRANLPDRRTTARTERPHEISPMRLPDGIKRQLPRVTTWSTLQRAPLDRYAFDRTSGHILHPTRPKIVYGRPGGRPIAVLPTHLVRNPTWVPVVSAADDWVRVLLPSRPNRSTGWIHTGSGGLEWARSDYEIHVSLSHHRMSIHKGGRRIGSWRVAVGAQNTPTPVGRTFVMGALDTGDGYGAPVLPLGAHSPTLRSFHGGPATIGLHGWPDSSVFGHSVSNGCVRVPNAALRVMSRIPLGTVVTITR